MPLDLNPSADLALADALEAVTYRRRGNTPGAAGTLIAHALRRSMTKHEAAASDGRYTTSDVVWHLPATEVAAPPQLGDMICDAEGQRWTILNAAKTILGSRWRCTTRSLALVFGLGDTITVLQAVAVGGGETTWRTWKTGIRARIQPLSTQSKPQGTTVQTTRRFQIFVAEALGLDATFRIRAADGRSFMPIGETAAQRIGELAVIEAEAA